MDQVEQRGTRDPGIVAAAVYADGKRVADIDIEAVRDWIGRPGHVVWIGLHEPSEPLLRRVQRQLELHDLAIADAERAHQRPKLEQYGDGLFIVVRTAQMVDGVIAFGETHLFVGNGYVVSVRHGASASYAAVRARCEASPKALSHGEDYILYAILDFVVDNFLPVVETLRSEADGIEERLLTVSSRADIRRMYGLRRDLLKLRCALAPLVEVCRELEHAEVIDVEPVMQPMFRDVTDHVRHMQEEIDALREVLGFAFEASMMMSQSEQTGIARRLAAWAAILAVPTAVAGIYGMNFEFMPELKWRYGYFGVLGVIVATCTWLYWRFRRNSWL